MPITNLPTFTDGQLLTAAQLNQIVTALQTKFSGNITASDLVWPLNVQGDIDFGGQHDIDGLRQFWETINVNEYDSFADAVAALPTGGGALYIPADTTVTADGVEITKPVAVFGAGKTSKLQLTSGSTSGYLLRVSNTSNLTLYNLTIDGNGDTGSGQDGVQIRNVDGATVYNCRFQDFSGDALYIGNDGTGGNRCRQVIVYGCQFDDGSADHIAINDVDGCSITFCQFNNATGDGIEAIPTSASSLLRSIVIANNRFSSCPRSVYIEGESGTASNNFRLIKLIGNESLTTSGVAFTLGVTSGILKEIQCYSNVAVGTTTDAFNILAEDGIVQGNYAPDAGADGCDLSSSTELYVEGNSFPDAGQNGINADSTTNCRILNNDVHNAAGSGIKRATTTGLVLASNHGDHTGSTDTSYAALPDETSSGNYTFEYVIPANTVKVGDTIRVFVKTSASGGASGRTIALSLDGGTTNIDIGTYSADGRTAGYAEFFVEALSGADSTAGSTAWVASTNQAGADAATWAADWTSDVTITYRASGGSIVLDHTSVEILGGQ